MNRWTLPLWVGWFFERCFLKIQCFTLTHMKKSCFKIHVSLLISMVMNLCCVWLEMNCSKFRIRCSSTCEACSWWAVRQVDTPCVSSRHVCRTNCSDRIKRVTFQTFTKLVVVFSLTTVCCDAVYTDLQYLCLPSATPAPVFELYQN